MKSFIQLIYISTGDVMIIKNLKAKSICVCIMGLFAFSAFAGPCSEFKQSLTAKKGTCKSLPQEQRASCREEIKAIKDQLKNCKMQAKANKGNKKAQPQ